jgi:hypothetical protein
VDELTTVGRNQMFPAPGVNPATLSSVSALDGDRILLDLGHRADATTNNNVSIVGGTLASFGGANDLTAGGIETTQLNPWVEFSQTLNFTAISGGDVVLEATVAGTASVESALSRSRTLEGASAGAATASGMWGTAVVLEGTSSGAATTTGLLETGVVLEATAAGTASVDGTLVRNRALEGASSGAATTTGLLEIGVVLEGTVAGAASVDGALSRDRALEGTSSGAATASGMWTSAVVLEGVSSGASTATGSLHNPVSISATGAGAASVEGTLSGGIREVALEGVSSPGLFPGSGTFPGDTTFPGAVGAVGNIGVSPLVFRGSAAGTSVVTASHLSNPVSLFGMVHATSTVSASLHQRFLDTTTKGAAFVVGDLNYGATRIALTASVDSTTVALASLNYSAALVSVVEGQADGSGHLRGSRALTTLFEVGAQPLMSPMSPMSPMAQMGSRQFSQDEDAVDEVNEEEPLIPLRRRQVMSGW